MKTKTTKTTCSKIHSEKRNWFYFFGALGYFAVAIMIGLWVVTHHEAKSISTATNVVMVTSQVVEPNINLAEK